MSAPPTPVTVIVAGCELPSYVIGLVAKLTATVGVALLMVSKAATVETCVVVVAVSRSEMR